MRPYSFRDFKSIDHAALGEYISNIEIPCLFLSCDIDYNIDLLNNKIIVILGIFAPLKTVYFF